MPPTPKPEERRQRRNGKKTATAKKATTARRPRLTVVDAGDVAAAATKKRSSGPAADTDWLASTKKQWTAFWKSPAAQKIEASLDLPAVERLFTLYDERARSLRDFRKARLVKGSQDQLVLNPLGRQINSLNTAILALEDRLGLSPMARLKLNISLGGDSGGNPGSLDELNESLNLDDDAFDD